MAKLYTAKQRNEALRSLEIKPKDDRVTGKEAAQILEWRAKQEFGIDRKYDDASLRKHVEKGNLKADPKNRKSRYSVEEIFDLVIYPTRGRPRQTEEQSNLATTQAS
jgi:hypothetical protein